MLGVSWRLIILVQDGWVVSFLNKFGYGCGSIWLVDVIFAMSLKEDSEQILFNKQKLTDSGT